MASYDKYTQKILNKIPTDSVAEFRDKALSQLYRHSITSVMLQLYFTWAAVGFSIAMIIFGVVAYIVFVTEYRPGAHNAFWLIGIGLAMLVLIILRLRKFFRRAAHVRQTILDLSKEIDSRASKGEIPIIPPEWEEASSDNASRRNRPMGNLPAPHELSEKQIKWGYRF